MGGRERYGNPPLDTFRVHVGRTEKERYFVDFAGAIWKEDGSFTTVTSEEIGEENDFTLGQ